MSCPSTPSLVKTSPTKFAGRGVILSIIDHGKETFASSCSQSRNSSSTNPRFFHSCAIVSTEVRSRDPLCEQLSIEDRVIGVPPGL